MTLSNFAPNTVIAQIPAETTELGDKLFQNSTNTLTMIEFLGNSVTTIGEYVCYNCRKLTSINLDKLTELSVIKNFAFWNCGFETLSLPNKIACIGSHAFRENPLTYTFHINSYLTYFDGSVFFGTNIKYECDAESNFFLFDGNVYNKNKSMLISVASYANSIEFPDCVTIIKTCAFSASSVTEVKLPDSVNALEIWAFHNVVSLKTLVLSSNIKEINESVIHTNPNLERIVMPEGVQKLKQGSICNNAKLLCLILPSSLTDVDPKSVQLCPRIFYTHHLHEELIEMYCIGGFPRRSLLQPLKCTQSSSKISSSFIFSVLFVICSN